MFYVLWQVVPKAGDQEAESSQPDGGHAGRLVGELDVEGEGRVRVKVRFYKFNVERKNEVSSDKHSYTQVNTLRSFHAGPGNGRGA